MDREELLRKLEAFQPANEQEERDREQILSWIRSHEDAFCRSNETAHMTASAWVIDRERTKVLMAYHNIYRSWAWLGGHADGEVDLAAVALREAKEESGLSGVRLLTDEILSLEVLTVDGHEKRGRYVPSHLHMNVTFLLEADGSEPLRVKADENSAVGWLSFDEALEKSTEPWFVERVYSKLNGKVEKLRREGKI